ncbi:MAG: hypothetical protein D6711_09190 [Chloroflexi bacterium]|nr:MAG: hypothetical protein D6711_09190 [Chloroflexota bacterium]
MSECVTRDYSLTVRLSPEEKAILEALVERFDLDKSATVRYALTLVLQNKTLPVMTSALPSRGQFVPLHCDGITIPVYLSRKKPHDR